jgi:hypothetical protein
MISETSPRLFDMDVSIDITDSDAKQGLGPEFPKHSVLLT